jgi:alkylation response protein AidB-like acyl-CoA dehydrogenase
MAPPEVDPKMGIRGVAEAVLRFDDVYIAAEDVLVAPDPASKRGAEILVNQFNPERCGNAAMCTGIAQAALDDSVTHLRARRQFGRPLVEFQGLQWQLAEMAMDVEVSRILTWRAARSTIDGFPDQTATIMAKYFSSEMVQRVTNQAIQMHGARGYSRRWPVERYFRDSRGLTMGGGTAEVMRNILAGITVGTRFSQRPPSPTPPEPDGERGTGATGTAGS